MGPANWSATERGPSGPVHRVDPTGFRSRPTVSGHGSAARPLRLAARALFFQGGSTGEPGSGVFGREGIAMEIKYAMNSPAVSVSPDAAVQEAARRMADAGVGALPVVQGERVIGVVTDRDLVVRALAPGLSPQVKVEDVMSTDPVTVEADTPVTAALHAMRSINTRHLPVVDHGRLVGMVSFDDLFSYLSLQFEALTDVVDAVRRTPGGSPSH